MQPVFQITKHKKAVLKIKLPFRSAFSVPMIFSQANSKGTKPTKRRGVVKGVGGQASHNKNALNTASI